MENLNLLLKRLLENKIDFVLVGGYAAVLHGASQVTQDIDICAALTEGDLTLLRNALRDLQPKHRMNPNFQPSLDDYPTPGTTIANYYLKTTSGILDIIERVEPVGDFSKIKANALTVEVFGFPCKVIALDDLIRVKETMSRPKDKAVLQELLETRSKLK